MAILGLRNDETRFVGKESRWLGGVHVPAHVRRQPFIFMTGADQAEFAPCADAASDLVVPGDANPFFRGGKRAEPSQNALAFCTAFQAELLRRNRRRRPMPSSPTGRSAAGRSGSAPTCCRRPIGPTSPTVWKRP